MHLSKHSNTHSNTHSTHTDTLVYINAKQKQVTHTQSHTHTLGQDCRAVQTLQNL